MYEATQVERSQEAMRCQLQLSERPTTSDSPVSRIEQMITDERSFPSNPTWRDMITGASYVARCGVRKESHGYLQTSRDTVLTRDIACHV